jgi:hypothetical protein
VRAKRIGISVTLRGTIERGAGERITADGRPSFLTLSCRIVAESFAPGGCRARYPLTVFSDFFSVHSRHCAQSKPILQGKT